MLALNRLFVATLEALAQTGALLGALLGAPPVEEWEPRLDRRGRRVHTNHSRGRR